MEQLVVGLLLTFFFLELLVELSLNEVNLAYVRRNGSAKVIPDIFHNQIAAGDYEKSIA